MAIAHNIEELASAPAYSLTGGQLADIIIAKMTERQQADECDENARIVKGSTAMAKALGISVSNLLSKIRSGVFAGVVTTQGNANIATLGELRECWRLYKIENKFR